jgi:hypothetical protein
MAVLGTAETLVLFCSCTWIFVTKYVLLREIFRRNFRKRKTLKWRLYKTFLIWHIFNRLQTRNLVDLQHNMNLCNNFISRILVFGRKEINEAIVLKFLVLWQRCSPESLYDARYPIKVMFV